MVLIPMACICLDKMAVEGCTLSVWGLPTDVASDRLQDKLFIHFLRPRNGGGEVTSVTVSKATPGSARVIFEDSRVALRVLRHCPHVLEVDGRRCELSLSLLSQEVHHPDKVILSMSVTVNCRQVPGGKDAVMSLHRSFPGLNVRFSPSEMHCYLVGLYSEVQPAVAHLLELQAFGRSSGETVKGESLLGQQERMDPTTPQDQGKPSMPEQTPPRLNVGQSGSLPFEAWVSEALSQTGGAVGLFLPEEQLTGGMKYEREGEEGDGKIEELSIEEMSLVMDADVFAYLSHRSEEYQNILSRHLVSIVDVTSEGVTTLYLQPEMMGKTQETSKVSLRQAREELNHLHQQIEGSLRSVQLKRSTLNLQGEFTAALKDLESLLPRVLLSCDQTNVCIVGDSTEVSQAKQLLMLEAGEGQATIHGLGGTSPSPTIPLSPPVIPTSKEGQGVSPVAPIMVPRLGKVPSNHGTEGKVESGKEYRLAARFRNSGQDILAVRLGESGVETYGRDRSRHANFETSPLHSGQGPAQVFSSVKSGSAGAGLLEGHRVTGPICTGEDILFTNSDLQSTTSRFPAIRTPSLSFMPTSKPKVRIPSGTSLGAVPGGNCRIKTSDLEEPCTVSGSSLRRANSFSGHSRPKHEVQVNGVGGEPHSTPTRRLRSSSFSGSEVAQFTVSKVMWNYMKEAYSSRLHEITSDLQLLDSQSEADEVRVTLKGKRSARVEERHQQLQRLVSMVASDFCILEVHLAELGVAEDNEIFEACCSDIRSRFRKVIVHTERGLLHLIGPKQLCSQVSKALMEIFPGVPLNKSLPDQEGLDHGQADRVNDEIINQLPERNNQSKVELPTQHSKLTKRHRSSRSHRDSGSFRQTTTKSKAVVKEKGGTHGKTETFESQSAEANSELSRLRKDWQPSPPLKANKSQTVVATGSKQNHMTPPNPMGDVACTCVCGESAAHTAQPGCGVALGRRGLLLHAQCRVCPREERWGSEGGPKGSQGAGLIQEVQDEVQGQPWTAGQQVTQHRAQHEGLGHREQESVVEKQALKQVEQEHEVSEHWEQKHRVPEHGQQKHWVPEHLEQKYLVPEHWEQGHQVSEHWELEHGVPEQWTGERSVLEQRAQKSEEGERKVPWGIAGTMSCVELPLSLPGYSSHTTMKITYCIPDGIQGDKHPSPGSTFRGGVFEAYVPLSPKGWSLLPCLEKAFQQGRTFTVAMGNATGAGGKARVVWVSIPHRTKMEGGESGNGYPDPTYLSCLAEALRNHGFEGLMDMSHHKSKS